MRINSRVRCSVTHRIIINYRRIVVVERVNHTRHTQRIFIVDVPIDACASEQAPIASPATTILMHKRHGIAGIERPAIGKSLAGAIALTKTGIDVKIDFGTAVIEIGAGIAAHLVNNLVIDAAGYTAEETATTVFFQNDIDDAGRTLGAVFGAGVVDDLHPFDALGWNLLQYLSSVVAGQSAGLSVDPHLHTAVATERDFAFGADFYRRDILEQVTGRTACRRQYLVDGKRLAVHFEFHLRPLSRDLHLLECLLVFGEVEQREGLLSLFLADGELA